VLFWAVVETRGARGQQLFAKLSSLLVKTVEREGGIKEGKGIS
jgi:hypothetical protein